MEASTRLAEVASDLQALFMNLTQKCLKEQPENVEIFCLEYLAKTHDMKLESSVSLMKDQTVTIEEDLLKLVDDIEITEQSVSSNRFRQDEATQVGYSSSDDSLTIRSVASYRTNGSHLDTMEHLAINDLDDVSGMKTYAAGEHIIDNHGNPQEVCYLFSTEVISPEELQEKTDMYRNDDRMISLFRAWDGDNSGAVDFIELVLALHKFEDVSQAGIDIRVASDALVQFVESDKDRELKLPEFTRVVILFALNNFKKDFEEVADHMLAVATSTSEKAVLKAASGVDVTDIEAADKEEEEFLRETVKAMEDQVTDNIRKLLCKRVAFSQLHSPK